MTWWVITNSTSKAMYASYVTANTSAILVSLLKSYSIFHRDFTTYHQLQMLFVHLFLNVVWYYSLCNVHPTCRYLSIPPKKNIAWAWTPDLRWLFAYIKTPQISPSCLKVHFIAHKDKTKGSTRILEWTRSRSLNFVVVVRSKCKVWSKSNFNGWVQSSRLTQHTSHYHHKGALGITEFLSFSDP